MAFLLLISGQVVEVSESRETVVGALSGAAQGATGTVAGKPMTFRASGIIAVAETREQVNAWTVPQNVLGEPTSESLPETIVSGPGQ